MAHMAPPHHTIRPSTSSGSFRNGSATVTVAGPSTSTASPSSSKGFAHTTLTLDGALAQANGDPRGALETVLSERNMLSSQNAQLWKLIEKQRVGYSSLMKELERVRAERDRAVGRHDGSENGHGARPGAPGSSAKIRPSPSAPGPSAFGQARSFSVEEGGAAHSRPRAPRQQSDQTHAGMFIIVSPKSFAF